MKLGNSTVSSNGRQYLQKKDFLGLMHDSDYALLKPNDIRKRYTEFVMFNKARALLPSRKKKKATATGKKERS